MSNAQANAFAAGVSRALRRAGYAPAPSSSTIGGALRVGRSSATYAVVTVDTELLDVGLVVQTLTEAGYLATTPSTTATLVYIPVTRGAQRQHDQTELVERFANQDATRDAAIGELTNEL